MISARPHINGNTVEDFKIAWWTLEESLRVQRSSMEYLQSNVLNWRNYQHFVDSEAAKTRSKDFNKISRKLIKCIHAYEEIKDELAAAIRDHES